jgi:hypothetical protein
MNIAGIVSQLKQERGRLDTAIRSLEGVSNHGRPKGSGPKHSKFVPKRIMSTASRKKIAAAQRKRWAAWKAKKSGKEQFGP